MKEYKLSLKVKTAQHSFSFYQIACYYWESFM